MYNLRTPFAVRCEYTITIHGGIENKSCRMQITAYTRLRRDLIELKTPMRSSAVATLELNSTGNNETRGRMCLHIDNFVSAVLPNKKDDALFMY